MKILFRMVVITMVAILSFSSSVLAVDLGKEEIIAKAKEALANADIVAVDCNILYDENNKSWEDWGMYVLRTPSDNNHGNLPHGILENYKYRAIYFDFYENAKKDVWVFMDPRTGKALAIYEKK